MSKGKILVVDDEDIVRTSCSRTLVPEGYEVRLAKNGVEGLQMAAGERFDLVLTDLKMPDMDGIEVLRIIKEKWPETVVIIVTGYQTVDTAVKAIKLGANNYIEKPFTPDALLSAVTEALTGK
ncbi:MAG: sigma-54-dependent Fis family transcriptional regulator [Nitrospiraceae bacterium]|jgi:DNA-binding NtrC family response regulator|nr:MAG: sigma-54-dependent Fis family transcriptional regulator [Nitrospiraceae bacterium]